jgi:3-deoxy-manno-octulosonate cytidylyltransferase (CMP-KDO synthetase)
MWVYDACKKVKNVNRVIIATDHDLIFNEAKSRKADVMMTSSLHQSGTDRCAEVAGKIDEDYIINVQGDEPFINPELLERMVNHLTKNDNIDILTLFHPLSNQQHVEDPSKVKLTKDINGRVLYFSRAPIPYPRTGGIQDYYKHIGIYGFRKYTLMEVADLKPSKLELAEGLEQLRWLENGYSVFGLETSDAPLGIDTPEDLEKAREFAKNHY